MNKQINEKPFFFTSILMLFILLGFVSSCKKEAGTDSKQTIAPNGSTIIYTDIKPDSAIIKYGARRQYNLDLNNDGIPDFIIGYNYVQNRCGGEGAAYQMIEYIDTAAGGNNQVLNNNGADTLNNSFVIGANGLWSANAGLNLLVVENSKGTCPWGNNHFGAWYNVTDKYLGLRLIKGGSIYYGWARLTSSGTSLTNFNEYSLTLKDYAYNSIPNQSILAGQTK